MQLADAKEKSTFNPIRLDSLSLSVMVVGIHVVAEIYS